MKRTLKPGSSFAGRLLVLGVVMGVIAMAAGGCAQELGRKQLERVAKDWCESIRASQVIPVYPLTEDIRPGDVFMVPVPIQEQARIYKERGFLPLDDLRLRLPLASYSSMYFDGYWKDGFGTQANPRPVREPDSLLIEANAPRAAFPTYTFEARTGTGAALALPVHGVPVGLNFMNADRAEGTITLSDARTYAAQAQEVYEKLYDWAQKPEIRRMLADVQRQRGHVIYLRAVTRVYMVGAVDVSLVNKDSTGAGLKVGAAPDVPMTDAEGNVNPNYDKLLARLNEAANGQVVRDVAGNMIPGAGVKFTSATSRSVSLNEAFDTLLAIGYLGFDVPVYAGGVIGGPVPTYARLEGMGADPGPSRVDVLTPEQSYFQVQMKALDATAAEDPARAVATMEYVVKALRSRAFTEAEGKIAAARQALGSEGERGAAKAAVNSFKMAAAEYVSPGGGSAPMYQSLRDAFAAGYAGVDQR